MTLQRVFGVIFGIAVTLGGTFGVGILRTPGQVAAGIGNSEGVVAVWVLGGLFALLSAASIAELATMMPKAGGFYVYAQAIFGDRAGFIVGWCDWLGQVAAVAYAAVNAGDLAARIWPETEAYGSVIGLSLIALLAVLHWMGVRIGGGLQQAVSTLLAIGFLALIVAALLSPPAAGQQSMIRTGSALAALMIALRAVIVTYDGWYSAIYFTEEVKDPDRDMPRAMLGGVAVVTVVFVGVNLALLHSLGIRGLAGSQLPATDMAMKVFGAGGATVITLVSLLAMPSLMNAVLMMATRILFAMSRDGLFWGRAARVNSRGTPDAAMWISAATAAALVATGTFERLLAMAAFFYAATYCSGFVGLLVLRHREPHARRPFRAWLYPASTLTVLAVCVVFLASDVFADPRNAISATVLLALGYPVSQLFGRRTA